MDRIEIEVELEQSIQQLGMSGLLAMLRVALKELRMIKKVGAIRITRVMIERSAK